jgi:hypothetical protein
MFSGLRHLEINGYDLSTAAAKGLLNLKPRLETFDLYRFNGKNFP